MNSTYHIIFFRRMTGEKGVMPTVLGRKMIGLSYPEAEEEKKKLEQTYGFLTDFSIQPDRPYSP